MFHFVIFLILHTGFWFSLIYFYRNTSCNLNSISRVPWADLPADILFIIFGLLQDMKNLNFLDLYQCLAVCRSWRFVAKQIWRNHILPTTPWLLQEEADYTIALKTNLYKWHKHLRLDTNDNDHSYSCSLDLYRMRTYASFDGWLLLGTSNQQPGTSDNQPFLYNPVTTLLLQLPLLPIDLMLHSHMKIVSSRATPTDPNCIICLKFSVKRELFYRNTITLAFCRPALSSSWLTLRDSVEDIIFCGGHFYAIHITGALFVYNDDIINGKTNAYTSWSWKKMKIGGEICNIDSRSFLQFYNFFFYLVESKSGELLMIKRIFARKCYTTKSFCTGIPNLSQVLVNEQL